MRWITVLNFPFLFLQTPIYLEVFFFKTLHLPVSSFFFISSGIPSGKFSLEPGGIQKYLNSREMIKCWAYDTYKERSDKIIQGKALK